MEIELRLDLARAPKESGWPRQRSSTEGLLRALGMANRVFLGSAIDLSEGPNAHPDKDLLSPDEGS